MNRECKNYKMNTILITVNEIKKIDFYSDSY